MSPNTTGKHFCGAGSEGIDGYGEWCILMTGQKGTVIGRWSLVNASRPLHSVSRNTWPFDGAGNHDVFFNNKSCVVVRAGVVERLLSTYDTTPVAEHRREGDLYMADIVMPGFSRQDLKA